MALVLVRADDLGVDRHVIESQRVGAHALLQTEVFVGVSGVDRRDLRLNALTVAAGVASVADIVFLEYDNAAIALQIVSIAGCRVSIHR